MATWMEARAAVAGSPASSRAAAFSDLYRAELDGQVRRATLMLGSAAQANDVVHDAMVELYRRWDHIERPAAYLSRAVMNGCRSAGRRRAVARRKLAALAPDEGIVDHDPLYDVLATLPFNQRAAVVLRYFVGMTNPEIATVLGCPLGSVGPWISRALDAMRPLLREGAT